VQLPFTPSEFVDVFGAYNSALWPAALALWLVSLGVIAVAIRASEPPHRMLATLLAVHWSWSGLAYHAAFFTQINPAAWLFTGLFLAEAVLFARCAISRGQLRFSTGPPMRRLQAGSLVAFSLVYPLINVAQGFSFPRMATFGVPCPTTILTLGLLLVAEPPSWSLAAIPIAWAVVAGSAAFLLGVHADIMLFVAAALLVGRLATRTRRRRHHRACSHEWSSNANDDIGERRM
jgi:Family of unknown function (DUF6064)